MNESKLLFPLVMLTLTLANCGPTTAATDSPSKPASEHAKKAKNAKKHGGHLWESLPFTAVSPEPDRRGPEVMLMLFWRPPRLSKQGDLFVKVENVTDAIYRNSNCNNVPECNDFARGLGGNERRVTLRRTCTGAFIDEHRIITAKHCVRFGVEKHWFGILSFRESWTIEGDMMKVPWTNVVKICHVEKSSEGDDVAIVHVCPTTTRENPYKLQTLELAPADADLGDRATVRSNALGATTKDYPAQIVGREARFTNFGGGSGSPVLAEDGKLIGVVSGEITHSVFIGCTPSVCSPQPVTWIDEIHELLDNGPASASPAHHPDCLKLDNTTPNTKPQ
ncbi:MAG: trypsin-like serine protease [Enhygromyxa sp.]